MKKQGRTHFIAGQEAFSYTPKFEFGLDATFRTPLFDIVNVHPLPNTIFGGRSYQLGNFMSGELMLAEMLDFGKAVYSQPKPMVHDEDNTASIYRDPMGWTIHRKRAWVTLLTGGHYDYIDFSITVGNEAGTRESSAGIRTWFKHLSSFIHSFDFVRSRPAEWIAAKPRHVVSAGLAVEGKDYIAYLADARERGQPGAGEPLRGPVSLALPAGRFAVSLYSPTTGEYSPAVAVEGDRTAILELLPFRHDIAIRAVRVSEPPAARYRDGRPAATLRLEAKDDGPILRHGQGPNRCDYLGMREAIAFEHGGTYYLHYDGAGPRGWLACLATSKDLRRWDLKGPILDFGAEGEDDAGTASSPWTIFDGKKWHMFYVGCRTTTPPPDRIPAVPYFTMKATAPSPAGPWTKQKVRPFLTVADTYYADTASPGQVVKHGNEYLMFFSAAAGRPLKRTLSIARTRDLDGVWRVDAVPALPPDEQIENSALYFEPANKSWFLFTNHVGIDEIGEYTESIWVYWSKDINKWDPSRKAIVLDERNCRWSARNIGMPSVVKVGNRLALFYDATAQLTDNMKRDIGLAWLDLPLVPPGE
jgi:predicted GH43/DUF377 family glycosyl hydrolase